MIESYAEEQEIEQQEQTDMSWQLAKVAGVYSDGLALVFPGESAAGGKHYKRNTSISFSAGQRVLVVPDSGTYIVVCPVG